MDTETGTSIWVARPDGSERKQISDGGLDFNPVWSPDGKYLAYLDSYELSLYASYDISLYATDTGEEKTLARIEVPTCVPNPHGIDPALISPFGMRNIMTWSPDGNSIVCVARSGDHTDLVLVGMDGDMRWLTNDEDFELNLVFSPDGMRLAYDSPRVTAGNRLTWYVNILELSTYERVQLTSGENFSVGPSWSPDGKNMAFVVFKPRTSRVWIADADGSNPRELSDDDQPECAPIVWHPDGGKMLYSSRGGICEFDLGSGEKRILTRHDGTIYTDYRYSPDGSKIIYCSLVIPLLLHDLGIMDSDGSHEITIISGIKIDLPLIKEATDFSIKDVDGKEFKLSDFRERVTVLAFVIVGSEACESQIESLKSIEEKYGDSVVIIVLGIWQTTPSGLEACDEETLRGLKDRAGVEWLFAKASEEMGYNCVIRHLPQRGQVGFRGMIPTTSVAVIDGEGYLRYYHPVITPSVMIENVIDRLV